ncbi:MAG: type VI secretion system tip protein VgrG [Polyangiaceae bacterium]|nr:type VI secretion system tip protein VgrG [Polyangiaceae bacterium]
MDAQLAGPLTIQSPLGDELQFRSMSGVEALSRPFVFDVDVQSARDDIAPNELLGQSVTIQLDLVQDSDDYRFWNGIVASTQYVDTGFDGMSRYRLTLRPWLWQLGLAADCRIFQRKSVPDIVKAVFEGRGFHDYETRLFEVYDVREYVVQYRETDLNFVSRLLEEGGIYYFFRHESGKHTLVLADSPQAHSDVSGYASLPYAGQDVNRDETQQYVRQWRAEGRLETRAYTLTDFDFTKSRVRVMASTSDTDEAAESNLEVYDYPGGFTTFNGATGVTARRLNQARREARTARGESNARGLTVGCTFKLEDHPRDDQNRKYLVTSARLHLRGKEQRMSDGTEEEPFVCAFGALDVASTFQPPRTTPKPFVRGPQTATVVGPSGQEIWTDQFGRIKVQFHWDRIGTDDEKSSCWVRVAQAWAGTGFGAQFVPRIGQEVVVDFLEGDPDRPIVTGSVYNDANMPPFELPANQTQSGVRTQSSPRGSFMNANEIRFEDLKGNEELYIQAEKDLNVLVKNDESSTIVRHRTRQIGGNDTLTVGLNQVRTIGLAETVTVGAVQATTVGAAQVVTVGAAQSVDVKGDRLLTVNGNETVQIGSSQNITIVGDLNRNISGGISTTTKGAMSETFGGKAESKHGDHRIVVVKADGGDRSASLHVEGSARVFASTTVDATALKGITITCGKSQIVVKEDSITISSPTVTFQSEDVEVDTKKLTVSATDAVTVTGSTVTLASSGANVTLDSNATVQGAQVKLGSGSGSSAQNSTKPPKTTTVVLNDASGKPLANQSVVLRFGGEGGSEKAVVVDEQGQVEITGDDSFDVLFPDADDASSA